MLQSRVGEQLCMNCTAVHLGVLLGGDHVYYGAPSMHRNRGPSRLKVNSLTRYFVGVACNFVLNFSGCGLNFRCAARGDRVVGTQASCVGDGWW